MFDKIYISDAQNNDPYNDVSYQDFDAKSASVFFGLGRRFTMSARLNFLNYEKLFITNLNYIFSNLCYAQSSISSARLQSIGSIVTVTGVVTNGDELGVIRYMEDSTAGIALYDLTTNNYLANVNRGDSLTITGELADYNGLLEVYVTGFPTIHSSNNSYPVPQIMLPAQIGEATESRVSANR